MHIVTRELSTMLQVTMLIRRTLLKLEWQTSSKRTHGILLEDLQI